MPNSFVFGDRGLSASGDTHPLWSLGHAVADSYLILGASAVGQIHLARGLPRDDAFIVRSLGPWVAVAVADGVGSRPLSRYGATYAVEALSALLLRPFAVPLSELRTSHGAGPSNPSAASIAPPAAIEDVELKVPFAEYRRGEGRASLIAGMQDWVKKRLGVEPSAPGTPLLDQLQQGGSLGWWLPEQAPLAPPDVTIPPTAPTGSQRPDPTQPRSSGKPAAAALQVPGIAKATAVPTDLDLGGVMHQAFEKTHIGLRGHAQSLGLELADLGCTALALLFNRETGRCAVGQVGDGAILGLTARGEVKELVDAPDPGDGQATYTLNRPNFQKYLAVSVDQPPPANPFIAFYVMTDGLSGDLLYTSQQDALSNWAQAIRRNLHQASSPTQAAAGMLNWLATYQVKGSWDDRTLVVITQQESHNDERYPTARQPGATEPDDDQ
ncbi:protein phosphatase 2C domain-containing protein [Candidatus Chloroploca sp. M-50]|uniref:Protein phosphatase 2C domain-containing protein n=1 Tax=Candidatus Chloroploca mongolica TaxID=2528176 RepID=A0ABS4DH92_9CHLR|nr:protein phosphatase 2C domain-containing protein [Candidatus Chloroploca mongolica]MBP1468804.1 protein phosphatase 2C domain-containing protein [Candidatus Chloroploca mongolica]